MARKLSDQELSRRRQLKALAIAKVLFDDQGYHTVYLEQIEEHLRRKDSIQEQQELNLTVPE